MKLRAALLATALAGCSASSPSLGPAPDLSAAESPDLGASVPADMGSVPAFAQILFSGCPDVGGDGGLPRCVGAAPLALTLSPLTSPGVTDVLWSLSDGGVPPSSTSSSVQASWPMPGVYPVRLAVLVGASHSHATAAAEVAVVPSPTGGACQVEAQCEPGDGCLCGGAVPDGGDGCPTELQGGLCTRACTGGACGTGEECADFSRSAIAAPQVRGEPYRRPICLRACTDSSSCRPGFTCRELPILDAGAGAGGSFHWGRACFPGLLGDVGHSCIDGNGQPAPGSCVGGACAPLGARNLCTSPCDGASCPSSTACATFNYDRAHPFCLPRCDQAHPCGDPLLDCQIPDGRGYFGFAVAGPPGDTFCAPRRCMVDGDCAPAGHCAGAGVDGGPPPDGGTPSGFCVH